MKRNYYCIFIFLIIGKLYSYDYTDFQKQYLYFPQSRFISSNHISFFLNGKPFSPTNVFDSNPASASMFSKFSLGIDFSYGSVIDDPINIHSELNRTNLYMPQAIGALIPINKFVLGLGFYRKYSASFSYVGYLPPTHREKDRRSLWDLDMNTIALIFSFDTQNLFKSSHHFLIGLKIEYNLLDYSAEGYGFTEKLKTRKANWILGVQYYNEKLFLLGLTFEHSTDLSGKAKFEGDELMYQNPSFEFPLNINLPSKISINSNIKLFKNIDLNVNYSCLFWKNIYSEYSNQNEYSFSLGTLVMKRISASLGSYYTYFSSSREDKNPTYPYDLEKVETEFYSLFIKANIGYSFSNYRFKLDVFDNRLFSSDNWKQTNIILSFAYSL